MTYIDIALIQPITLYCQNQPSFPQYFRLFQKKYKTCLNFDLYGKILEKIQRVNNSKKSKFNIIKDEENSYKKQAFVFGEAKIFTYILVSFCFKNNKYIQSLNQNDFNYICSIFCKKNELFVRYQILCLGAEGQKNLVEWTQKEIQCLKYVIAEKNTINQWKVISFSMFCESQGKIFRPLQQCRQKWINHLDPNVKKGQWTLQEDIQLFRSVDFLGCRWAEISRDLGSTRTEHMIKNRYNSLIKKWKKKYQKTNPKKIVQNIIKHLKAELALQKSSKQKIQQLKTIKTTQSVDQKNLNFKEQEQKQQNQIYLSLNNQRLNTNNNNILIEQNYSESFYQIPGEDGFDLGINFEADKNYNIYDNFFCTGLESQRVVRQTYNICEQKGEGRTMDKQDAQFEDFIKTKQDYPWEQQKIEIEDQGNIYSRHNLQQALSIQDFTMFG